MAAQRAVPISRNGNQSITRSKKPATGEGAPSMTAPERRKRNATNLRGSGPKDGGGAMANSVIRDSFTMPSYDYARIGALKKRCLGLGLAVKKSELLRAGLHALDRISDENLTLVVSAVERIKTGRPVGKKDGKHTRRGKSGKA